MKFFFTLIFLIVLNKSMISQKLIDTTQITPLSRVFIDDQGQFIECGIFFSKDKTTEFYILDNQCDVLMSKEYFLNGKIYSIGYYHWSFNGFCFCWYKYLNWIYFDENGRIINEIFYDNK